MRAALVFRQFEKRSVPAIGAEAGGGVNRDAEVVADFRTGDALRLIFVKARRPFSGGIALGKGGNAQKTRCQQQQGSDRRGAVDVLHYY